jgi:hypothetical protein
MPAIRPIKTNFGKEATEDMWKWVEESTTYWFNRTRKFREEKLKEFARLYKGKPVNDMRDIPWPGASNIEIQIIASNSDNLLSRVMSMYMTEPIWTAKVFGDIEQGAGVDQKSAIEQFLTNMALEPAELDFYRVEEAWFSSTIRNGTGIIKFPWMYNVETQYVSTDGIEGSDFKYETKEIIRLDGPRPEVVPLNKFLTDISTQKLDDSKFKCHIITLTKKDLENRKALKFFSDTDLDDIIAQPDRSQADVLQDYVERSQGLEATSSGTLSDEYDLYECWYKYQHNGQNLRLVAIHHPKSKTRLASFYNYYPDNMDVFEDAKLAYDDDQYYGYGFAEMLQALQEEISELHRQRINAKTLSNTTAFRVNKNSKLHSILQFYPGVLVPADPGEIERLELNNPQADNLDGENLSLALVKERTGIDPATGGTGGGIVNSKRGIYSSQGTFAVLQQQNSRTGLRMSDMRSAHSRAGTKFAKLYANFGLGKKLRQFGDNAEQLRDALDNIKSGKLGLSVRASTASMNKELEKQNDIMLATTLTGMYQQDAQMIQAMGMEGMPPDLKAYYVDVLRAKQALFKQIAQNFGHDDVARLIPTPQFLKAGRPNELNAQQSSGRQQGSPQPSAGGGSPAANGGQGNNPGAVPITGGPGFGGVPVSSGGSEEG